MFLATCTSAIVREASASRQIEMLLLHICIYGIVVVEQGQLANLRLLELSIVAAMRYIWSCDEIVTQWTPPTSMNLKSFEYLESRQFRWKGVSGIKGP